MSLNSRDGETTLLNRQVSFAASEKRGSKLNKFPEMFISLTE